MRKRLETEWNTDRELGEEIRGILNGRDARRQKDGPEIYPGMEDAGIGSVLGDLDDLDDLDDPDGAEDGGPEPFPEFRKFPERWKFSMRDDNGDEAGADGEDEADDEDGADGDDGGSGISGEKRKSRGPYLFISCAFIILFVLLMGNLIYFNVYEKDGILNSPYNRRQNSQAERVVRGAIKSIDGSTLARTNIWDDGTEERVYPYANIFAHTVGFTSHGKSGLESIANYQLLTSHNNIIDQIINEFRKKKNPGDTVVTTMNASLQEACYYALGDYRGAVILLEPKTGAIRAMVSKPDFDPNTLGEIWDEMVADSSNSQLLNRATQGLYPPGSIFKIVTALSYYRRYRTFDRFSYNCTGELEIDDFTVHCYKGSVHGEESFAEAFARSCNTAFSQIGLDLGTGRLTSTAKDLLFGERLPSELNSSTPRWQLDASATDVDLVQTAFGQGKTLTTPYHMALLVSAIANNGVIMKPYLIDHVENTSGDIISRTKASQYRRLITEDEAQKLTELMTQVVTSGTASALSGRSYQVAGKTGSAEYYKNDGSIGTHSWFVGFTNPGDPDVAVVVIAENGGAGSSTAVPIASAVLEAYYAYR